MPSEKPYGRIVSAEPAVRAVRLLSGRLRRIDELVRAGVIPEWRDWRDLRDDDEALEVADEFLSSAPDLPVGDVEKFRTDRRLEKSAASFPLEGGAGGA